MKYEIQKEKVRSTIESFLNLDFDDKQLFIDAITEKVMARQFNQKYYQGEGKSTGLLTEEIFKVDFLRCLKAIVVGLSISGYAIFRILFSSGNPNPIEKIGWVYAIPKQYFANKNTTAETVEFLESTLARFGNKLPAKYLLQSGAIMNKSSTGKLQVVTHIGTEILTLESQSKTKTIKQLFCRTLFWLKTSMKHQLFLEMGPEYIVDALAIQLRNRIENDSFITTQSQLLFVPLVFRTQVNSNTFMYWYSSNSVPILKTKSEDLDYTYLSQPLISTHFVWTSSWGRIIKTQNCNAVILAIGPIIFRNLPKNTKRINKEFSGKRDFLIFDVTPKKNVSKHSFYSDQIMKDFVSDILITSKTLKLNVSIKLKPKRKYSTQDSVNYRKFLQTNVSNIEILNWDCDMVEEIMKSNLVICIPFTSPALVCKHLGIASIFYSPSADFGLDNSHENIPVVKGQKELHSFLREFNV